MKVLTVEQIAEHFRIVTVQGAALEGRNWMPGDRIQITFAGWQQRAYTPFTWSASEGSTSFLAYVHGNGVGSAWAAELRSGARCNVFGPRDTVDLTALSRSGLLFGDETSLSTAAALRCTPSGERAVHCLFEVTSVAECRAVLDALGVARSATLVERRPNDAHFAELEQHALGLLGERVEAVERALLTGNAAAIQHLYKAIRRSGSSVKVKNRPYWALGKRGLE